VRRERARSDGDEGGEVSGAEERSGARCRGGEEEMKRRRKWSVGWGRSEGAG